MICQHAEAFTCICEDTVVHCNKTSPPAHCLCITDILHMDSLNAHPEVNSMIYPPSLDINGTRQSRIVLYYLHILYEIQQMSINNIAEKTSRIPNSHESAAPTLGCKTE